MTQLPPFKSRFCREKPTAWGSWLMAATPTTAEALGHAGFDFLVVDLEHVPVETPQAIEILRALAATGAEPVVRLAANDKVLIKKALDIGARSLMLPFVQSAEEARAAVSASFYPPRGERGVAAMHRASHYGSKPGYFADADQSLTLIAQIETAQAVARIDEIAAVDGIDALFVGPGDLAASLGHLGEIAAPTVQEALRQIASRCNVLGKSCGTVAPNVDLALKCVGYGYDFVAIASDLGFMMGAARSALNAVRVA